MLRRLLNPAGGIRYHLRARARTREWVPFRVALDHWFEGWAPTARTLAIVGPSGGYCLPLSLLARFERLICFEPDPIARWILARRLRRLRGSRSVIWISEDAWIGPLLKGGALPTAQLTRDTALLFTNFIGQLAFLVPDERWSAFQSAWQAGLWPLLERVPWASFHDRVSGPIAPLIVTDSASLPSKDALESPAAAETFARGALLGLGEGRGERLEDDAVIALYGPDQAGELLDHRSGELLPAGRRYGYFHWPLIPDQHHLIECVSS